jgi:cell volume regulation protein A
MTLAALFRRTIQGNVERGDRVPYGPVDFIVRETDEEHQILEVGLALEHDLRKQAYIPLFQTPREMAAILKRWVGRKSASAEPAAVLPAGSDPLPAAAAPPAEDGARGEGAAANSPPPENAAVAVPEDDRRDAPAA